MLPTVGAGLHDMLNRRKEPRFGFIARIQEATMMRAAKADDFDPFDGVSFLHGMPSHAAYADHAVFFAIADDREAVLFQACFVSIVLQGLHCFAAARGGVVSGFNDLNHTVAFIAAIDGKLFGHDTLRRKKVEIVCSIFQDGQ